MNYLLKICNLQKHNEDAGNNFFLHLTDPSSDGSFILCVNRSLTFKLNIFSLFISDIEFDLATFGTVLSSTLITLALVFGGDDISEFSNWRYRRLQD